MAGGLFAIDKVKLDSPTSRFCYTDNVSSSRENILLSMGMGGGRGGMGHCNIAVSKENMENGQRKRKKEKKRAKARIEKISRIRGGKCLHK
jgi:hypothetical protein